MEGGVPDSSSSEVSVSELFERFIEATTMKNVITIHRKILDHAELEPCEFNVFFPRYKRAVTSNRQRKNWKAKALFSKIEKRANHKCYSNTKPPQQQQPMSNIYNNSNRTSDNTQAGEFNANCVETTTTTTVTDTSLHSLSSNRGNLNYSIISSTSSSNNNNNNNALQNYKCLIIGSGPAGLRTAIELQLLGGERVVVVEKRSRFSRNNVLHLWPFVIDDLKSLGAKKFYGKFCAGSIDHISIRQLQLMLLKVCLMIGCDFRDSCSYVSLCPASIKQQAPPALKRLNPQHDGACEEDAREPAAAARCTYSKCAQSKDAPAEGAGKNNEESQATNKRDSCGLEADALKENLLTASQPFRHLRGAIAHFESDHARTEEELGAHKWDVIVGADGRRNTLKSFFPRKEFRGRLAIAITANFINRQTPAEACVPEISGLSFIYNQDMFNALAYDTGIQLENICYYKDDTHYFVMTAKKKSLLERGVLIRDYAATQDLLSEANVNKEALLKYAKDAAFWTTGLEPLDFALNHYGQEDCAMFDFTSMYAASNACKALRTVDGGLALVSLVGDSLLEPFWPTGSGCARGFLSSFDAAWMCRQWAVNKCAVLDLHGTSAGTGTGSRSARNRNASLQNAGKQQQPSTHDKMALSVMAERESIYRILAQTTSENLQQNYAHWTLNPHTRYPNLNRHLMLPSQVEHLISDASRADPNLLSPTHSSDSRTRRVKSPGASGAKTRRSPKKLKSAGASPMAQPKNVKNRAKSMPKTTVGQGGQRSKSRHELSSSSFNDYYLELEESYRNLADSERGGMTQYLSYRRAGSGGGCGAGDSSDLDDLFVPSISGTLPSSHNLSKLEARKARDIDECLRQRRQKTKITLVRDQLISQMRGGSDESRGDNSAPLFKGGNAALFNEIKRMREQQSRGDSKPRDLVGGGGPLSLLNSMRRCASFAERVKSFESKLSTTTAGGDSCDSSAANTPRTPIDNVKNLPQFATLQELFVNSSQKPDDHTGKSRIPVTKLTKDDWNVKCWENRFGPKQQQRYLSSSTRSLNKATSVDTGRDQFTRAGAGAATAGKPKKQVDVFQDRINQMANKLKTVTDTQSSRQRPSQLRDSQQRAAVAPNGRQLPASGTNGQIRSQGWVNHLKRELAKGAADSSASLSRRTLNGQPMNPAVPNKPIRKLFPDDDDNDEGDDGIDVNKHYDHLCVNRPTNKYLARGGGYKSHLARSNATTGGGGGGGGKIIDRTKLAAEHRQVALTSRGSSASSTLSSDYSTNTGGHSSPPAASGAVGTARAAPTLDVECFRCRKFVSTSERITLGACLLHRACLTCASCGITLRSNELQHYIAAVSEARANRANSKSKQVARELPEIKFECAICEPSVRVALAHGGGLCGIAEQAAGAPTSGSDSAGADDKQSATPLLPQRRPLQSREEFLNSRINYSELYKNILVAAPVVSGDSPNLAQTSPSPVQVTLPLNIVNGASNDSTTRGSSDSRKFSIAESETALDGSERVTLILPSESATVTPSNNGHDDDEPDRTLGSRREMIDEEELQRILHLDNGRDKPSSRKSSSAATSGDEVDSSSSSCSSSEDHARSANKQQRDDASLVSRTTANSSARPVASSDEDSSSLDLPEDSADEDEDEDDDDEQEEDDECQESTEEEDEDDDDNVDMNSTCDDFITTEEFDATSDKENEADESTLSEVSSGRRANNCQTQGQANKSAVDLPAS